MGIIRGTWKHRTELKHTKNIYLTIKNKQIAQQAHIESKNQKAKHEMKNNISKNTSK